MTAPVEHRQYADERLKAIWIARVPEVRSLLLSMAKLWTDLAERFDERETQQSPAAEESTPSFDGKKPPAPSISRRSRARQAS